MLGIREWWSWRTLVFVVVDCWPPGLPRRRPSAASFRSTRARGQSVRGLDARFEFPGSRRCPRAADGPGARHSGRARHYRICAHSRPVPVAARHHRLLQPSGCPVAATPSRPSADALLASCAQGRRRAPAFLGSICSFACLVPLPGLSLVVKDPGAIVADLHSHTLLSHDAIVSLQGRTSPIIASAASPSSASPTITPRSGSRGRLRPRRGPRTPEIVRGVELRILGCGPEQGICPGARLAAGVCLSTIRTTIC